MIAPKKSDINYQKPKNWLLPLTGESLLVFCFFEKEWYGKLARVSVNFPPSLFPRSLAFEFLRSGYRVQIAIRSKACILSLVTAQILAIKF